MNISFRDDILSYLFIEKIPVIDTNIIELSRKGISVKVNFDTIGFKWFNGIFLSNLAGPKFFCYRSRCNEIKCILDDEVMMKWFVLEDSNA